MEEEGKELGLKSISLEMFINKGERGREEVKTDRKSTRLNSSHIATSRMPSSA